MFGFLLGLWNPLKSITKELIDWQVKKQDAKTEQERIAADERIKALEARRDVILQAQKDPYERWIRILWAIPMLLYTWKLVVWDKILEWGATDNLSPELWNIFMIILAGYFVDTVVKRFKS